MLVWIIFVIVIVVVINKAKQSAQGQKYRQELDERGQQRMNSVDKEKEAQRQREMAVRQMESRKEEEIKRLEEAARREADRLRQEQLKEEQQRKEEIWAAMNQQGSYRSAARKEELLKKYKAKKNAAVGGTNYSELEEDIRQGRILSRSEDYVDEDFDVDVLEQEDFVAQIEDLIVMGPHYALSKDRDFMAEADELLWSYKVS